MKAQCLDGDRLSIRTSLRSTPDAVSETLREVRVRLNDMPPLDCLDSTWEVIVAEVLNNIVEHAYDDSHTGEIDLTLLFGPTTMNAEFIDYGRAMPNGTLPCPRDADLDVPRADLPEGGFGWMLIHTLASHVEYRHDGGSNRLALELRLDTKA